MARFVGRVVLKGAAAAGIVTAGVLSFNHVENTYWYTHDPWRQRRVDQSGQGGEIAAPGRKADQVHYGWSRDEDGSPFLMPMGGGSSGNRQRIVLLGTGWGARYFLAAIDRDRYEVRVVSPRNFFLFTPLLPSTSTGTLSTASICSPIRELISCAFSAHVYCFFSLSHTRARACVFVCGTCMCLSARRRHPVQAEAAAYLKVAKRHRGIVTQSFTLDS